MFLGLESLAAPIIPKPVTAGTRPPTLVRFQEPSSPTNAWLAEIGPNHRIWTDVTIPTDSAGQPLSHGSNHLRLKNRIRDIGSGIHYWNGEQYVSSVATFEVSPDATAFMATKVQHKTRLAVNLNTPNAVTVSHNGVTLNSTPVAIGILDAVSGRTVIIAGITNCQGRLSSSNVVYYENALVKEDGTPVASILYTIERGSLAQDVVVTSRIDPADYDIPTGSARIQIWSEFYGQIPVPDRLRRPIYV
ncbi:MAG TPA: hypothetical protein VLT36_04580, partial [Candidatus Dormibacteraeota bacterium]|nr:hypothetical protein [Candidatus Dormibacteraeota bacterium]